MESVCLVAAGYSIRYRAMSASANSTPVNVIAENEEQVQEFKQLNAVNDRYGGVIVEMSEPMDPAAFASSLRASIAQWRHPVSLLLYSFC